MRLIGSRLIYLCLLAINGILCATVLNAKENKFAAPTVETENYIGLKHIKHPSKYFLIFNGDFNLGTAGTAIEGVYTLEAGYGNIPPLTTVRRKNGDKCLKVSSCSGRVKWILLAREVRLPADTEIELSFEGRIEKTPGSGEIKPVYIDFRRIPQCKTPQKYWMKRRSLKLEKKWKKFSAKFKTEYDDYYRIIIVCASKDITKPMPHVYLDSLHIKVMGQNSAWTAPQAQLAIYEDKDVPAYQRNENVSYKINGVFPGRKTKGESIYLDIIDDQTFDVISIHKAKLVRQKSGAYVGNISFPASRYGSFSTRVRQGKKQIESFGGDFVVIHSAVKHLRGSIGWSIGVNGWNAASAKGVKSDDLFVRKLKAGSMKKYYETLQAAGIKTDRNWGFYWRAIEPEKGKFRFSFMDKLIKEHKKRGIEVIGVLGCWFKFGKNEIPEHIPKWAAQFCAPHKITSKHPSKSLIPPVDLWKIYCKTIMERYKDDIKIWEMLNEPCATTSVDEYMTLLKATRETAKSVSPEIKIIGPCPTGDSLKPRFRQWSREIIDAGGEKYLDGFSYHPYGAGNDFQKGGLFAATNLIDSVRSRLTNKSLPLYNTECFYLPNEKYVRCDRWDASAALRSYLINLGNGVRLCSAIDASNLFKDRLNPHVRLNAPWRYESVPAPVCAAFNNLSFLLKGMTNAKILKFNQFIRSYLFYNSSKTDKDKALAVVWELRPGGSNWTSKASGKEICFFDMWGNKMDKKQDIHLALNPICLTGPRNLLEQYLEKSTFLLEAPVRLFARSFGKDLYLEAKNMSGADFSPDIELAPDETLKLPESMHFVFYHSLFNTVHIPEVLQKGKMTGTISCTIKLEGKKIGSGSVCVIPRTESYNLPFYKKDPLCLKLSKGSTAKFAAQKESLNITVSVQDASVVFPKKSQPWTGDSLEIFIDCAPFKKMEQNLIRSGNSQLPVWQYAIPARLNPEDPLVWSTNKSPYKATAKTALTKAGYSISVKIPWQALKGPENRYRIYGINLEINHLNKTGGQRAIESLSGKGGTSFRTRLHYLLFKAPKEAVLFSEASSMNELVNGSFEFESKKGQPLGWTKGWEAHGAKIFSYGPWGRNGTKGIKVNISSAPEKKTKAWKQKINCTSENGTVFLVEGLVKADNLRTAASFPSSSGVRFSAHFYDEKNKKHMANIGYGIKGRGVTGSFDWRKFQFVVPVPKGATVMSLNCGLSSGALGAVYFDDIHLKTLSQ